MLYFTYCATPQFNPFLEDFLLEPPAYSRYGIEQFTNLFISVYLKQKKKNSINSLMWDSENQHRFLIDRNVTLC